MYERILIPTDGSDISRRASEQAIELAEKLGATVVIAFVIDTRTFPGTHPIVPESMAPHYFSLLDEMRKAGAQAVKDVAEIATAKGVKAETEVVEGTPAPCIIEVADSKKCELIVMGTHGRSGIAALLLGSTAHAVVHDASLPVLLVR